MITVDERLQLIEPSWLTSISLNGAIHLQWEDASYLDEPTRFKWYRVYSTAYDLDAGLCGASWLLDEIAAWTRMSQSVASQARAASSARRTARKRS